MKQKCSQCGSNIRETEEGDQFCTNNDCAEGEENIRELEKLEREKARKKMKESLH